MTDKRSLFFCAIGGSGMMPLALMMKARGYDVAGSDRARDQGRTPERFAFLEQQGVHLFPQNGSGISEHTGKMVVSTAVEKTVPDYQAALEKKIPVIHRAALLAEISNSARTSIAIAGTSGKSTTTGMTGWILACAKKNQTIVNGAVMKNFVSPAIPFASSVVGDPDLFVAEVDESDGSIENFSPSIAVLNNIAVDHKTMDELRTLFADFITKAPVCVINLDNDETAKLAAARNTGETVTFSLTKTDATLVASNIKHAPDGTAFDVTYAPDKTTRHLSLRVMGHHNVANALAALGATLSIGVSLDEACAALSSFEGIARRMDVIGTSNGVTVIDDFAHNPDKIAASLRALHEFEGRLLILFQPHGYGPLKLMRDGFIDVFATNLKKDDALFMCDPLYLGGTTSRDVTSADIVAGLTEKQIRACAIAKREDCAAAIIKMAQKGDRIVIMGARDDTLPQLAKEILFHVGIKQGN